VIPTLAAHSGLGAVSFPAARAYWYTSVHSTLLHSRNFHTFCEIALADILPLALLCPSYLSDTVAPGPSHSNRTLI
jgi:hypothetical protein